MKKFVIFLLAFTFSTSLKAFDMAAPVEDAARKIQAKKDAAFTPGRPYDQERLEKLAELSEEEFNRIISVERDEYFKYLENAVKTGGYYDYNHIAKLSTEKVDKKHKNTIQKIFAFIRTAPKIPMGPGYDYSALMPKDAKVFLLGEVHGQETYPSVGHFLNSVLKSRGLAALGMEHLFEGFEDYAQTLACMDKDGIKQCHLEKVKEQDMAALNSFFKESNLYSEIRGTEFIGLDSTRVIFCGLNIDKDVKVPPRILGLVKKSENVLGEHIISLTGRNSLWLNKLLPYLKDGGNIAVFGGYDHMRYNAGYSLGDYFAKTEYTPVVIQYIEGNRFADPDIFDISVYEYWIKVPQDKKVELEADYFVVYWSGSSTLLPLSPNFYEKKGKKSAPSM